MKTKNNIKSIMDYSFPIWVKWQFTLTEWNGGQIDPRTVFIQETTVFFRSPKTFSRWSRSAFLPFFSWSWRLWRRNSPKTMPESLLTPLMPSSATLVTLRWSQGGTTSLTSRRNMKKKWWLAFLTKFLFYNRRQDIRDRMGRINRKLLFEEFFPLWMTRKQWHSLLHISCGFCRGNFNESIPLVKFFCFVLSYFFVNSSKISAPRFNVLGNIWARYTIPQ